MRPKLSKRFIIMIDYGSEGFKPHGETDCPIEASALYREALTYGSGEVYVFEPYSIGIDFNKKTEYVDGGPY